MQVFKDLISCLPAKLKRWCFCLTDESLALVPSNHPPADSKELDKSILDIHGRILRYVCLGYARAGINRAMQTVPENSLVAVLSTSTLLLPVSHTGTPSTATSTSDAGYVASGGSSEAISEEISRDIFVAYERMKNRTSVRKTVDPSSGSPGDTREEAIDPTENDRQARNGADGALYDQYGHVCHQNITGSRSEGLLVTAMPARLAADRPRAEHSPASPPGSEGYTTPATRLKNVAALPLLVFDTETFKVLGELDERFAFQGGVAEWVSRANMETSEQGGSVSTVDDCGGASLRRRSGSPGICGAKAHLEAPTAPPGPGRDVRHIHQRTWGEIFVRSWAEDGAQPTGFAAQQATADARSPGVDRLGDGVQQGDIEEQAFLRARIEIGESGQSKTSGATKTSEMVILDQWSQMPPARLEALIQADADLFFLPLLLLRPISGETILHAGQQRG